METIKFGLDGKGYAFDYAPTLISDDFEDRGVYYCIHDNAERDPSAPRFAVSIFPIFTGESDDEVCETLTFRNFDQVVRFFRAIGLTVETDSLFVKSFLGKINRDEFR